MLSSIPPLQDDEENASYDVESSFTNILIEETINYIIVQIHVHKKLPYSRKLTLLAREGEGGGGGSMYHRGIFLLRTLEQQMILN